MDVLCHCLDNLPGIEKSYCADVRKAVQDLGKPPGGWQLEVNADPAQRGWCHLQALCNVVHALVVALHERWGLQGARETGVKPQLRCHTARVVSLSHCRNAGRWSLQLRPSSSADTEAASLECDAVVLAIGGRCRQPGPELKPPPELAAKLEFIPQTEALSLRQLAARGVGAASSVVLVGNSHSAFIIVANLYQLGCRSVTMFARRALRFAEWDEARGMYAANAFCGLRGELRISQCGMC